MDLVGLQLGLIFVSSLRSGSLSLTTVHSIRYEGDELVDQSPCKTWSSTLLVCSNPRVPRSVLLIDLYYRYQIFNCRLK